MAFTIPMREVFHAGSPDENRFNTKQKKNAHKKVSACKSMEESTSGSERL
jgi:hypothetical protein